MAVFEGTDNDTSRVYSVLAGKGAQPATFDKWIQTNLTNADGDNDLRSILADIKSIAESGASDSETKRALEKLQHLTRDILDTETYAWTDAVDADGAVAYGVAVNNMIALDDSDFSGGANITIPAKTTSGRRLIYIFVRLPIAADRTLLRLNSTPGGTIPGNQWATLPVSGVTEANFDRDTYTYWWAETDLDEEPEQDLQLEKRVTTVDKTAYDGSLGGAALAQLNTLAADIRVSIEHLQHLTRDIHDHEDYGQWEAAANSDGDLLEADISQSMPTLTDALFDGNGSTLTVPDTQNELTQIYIRIRKGVDRNTLRVVLDKGESYERAFPGNQWFSEHFQKPTSAVYDYFEVDRVSERSRNHGRSCRSATRHRTPLPMAVRWMGPPRMPCP